MSIMALPFPLRAVFMTCFVYKGHAHQLYDSPQLQLCHINERETPKTCLTIHKGSISHHIMPLVINCLGGGHTHAHAHTHRHTQTHRHTHMQAYSHHGQKQFQETSHAPAEGWRTPGLKRRKIRFVKYSYISCIIICYH